MRYIKHINEVVLGTSNVGQSDQRIIYSDYPPMKFKRYDKIWVWINYFMGETVFKIKLFDGFGRTPRKCTIRFLSVNHNNEADNTYRVFLDSDKSREFEVSEDQIICLQDSEEGRQLQAEKDKFDREEQFDL